MRFVGSFAFRVDSGEFWFLFFSEEDAFSVGLVVQVLSAIIGKLEPGLPLGNVVESIVSFGVRSELLANRLCPGRSGLGKGEDDDVALPQSVGLGDSLGQRRDVGHHGVAAGSPLVPFCLVAFGRCNIIFHDIILIVVLVASNYSF